MRNYVNFFPSSRGAASIAPASSFPALFRPFQIRTNPASPFLSLGMSGSGDVICSPTKGILPFEPPLTPPGGNKILIPFTQGGGNPSIRIRLSCFVLFGVFPVRKQHPDWKLTGTKPANLIETPKPSLPQ